MSDQVSRETPPAPEVARGVFAERMRLAEDFAGLLATDATVRGLIGPREIPRLWERHLLNCAVVADLVPEGAGVADIGSGAGLPGMVLAIRRPDLRVTLVEPLLRRVDFLREATRTLDLGNVEVVRARGEELHGTREFDVVTSRAVAALTRLLPVTMPLVRPGGQDLAMKGSSASTELAEAAPVLRRVGGTRPRVRVLGEDVLTVPTTVVQVWRRPGERPGGTDPPGGVTAHPGTSSRGEA